MKRFYKIVSHTKEQGGYAILLDGKSVHTPAKNKLICAHEALADAVMQEWAAQDEAIEPDSMPLTQLVSTKIDRVGKERAAMSAAILKYLNTDLLCYRTDEQRMAQVQNDAWDKWLDWFAQSRGIRLPTTTTFNALQHSEEAHTSILHYVKSMCDDQFTVFQLVTSLSGSLVLALAFMEGAASAEDIFSAARAEELYNAKRYNEEKYGPDPLQEKKDIAVKADLAAAAVYLALLSS